MPGAQVVVQTSDLPEVHNRPDSIAGTSNHDVLPPKGWRVGAASSGLLYAESDKTMQEEDMLVRALRAKEKAWGAEHSTTLATVNHLGDMYANHGKFAVAEEMYLRALQGYQNAEGKAHPKTREIARNLESLRAF